MNLLFHCLTILSFLALAFASCPGGSIPSMSNNSTCFLFVPQKQRLLIAEEYCNSQNGHLTSIHDIFANMQIQEHAQDAFTDSTTGDFWIGLNDLKSSGTWGWIDGTPLDFVDWDKGQPKSTPGYDCGGVSLQDGRWISDDCDKEKPYVCDIKISAVSTTPLPVKKCPDSWSFYDKTGFCYFVGRNKSWEESEDFCVSQNSHLASIHSLEENSFVTNLIPFDPNNHGCNIQQYAWIGLYTVTNQTSWRWTDSTKFNYSVWAPGRPGYPNSLAYCALIWNGPPCNAPLETWADDICNRAIIAFYVCKKLP